MSKALLSMTIILGWMATVGPTSDFSSWFSLNQAAPNQSVDPDIIWARTIEAKGGAGPLGNIKSFVIASAAPGSASRPDVASQFTTERLALLPARLWIWADFRPGSFGVSTQ